MSNAEQFSHFRRKRAADSGAPVFGDHAFVCIGELENRTLDHYLRPITNKGEAA
jgi:hypothetical protein